MELEKRIEQLENDMETLKSLMQKMVMRKEITVEMLRPILHIVKVQEPLKLSQEQTIGRLAIIYAEGLLPKDKAFPNTQVHRLIFNKFGTKESNPNLAKALTQMVQWGYFKKVHSGKRVDHKVVIPPEEARAQGLIIETTRRT